MLFMSKIEPVPFTDVTIQDRFWAPRQEVNRRVTVEHCLQMLEEAGNIENFRLAAGSKHEGYHGPVYMDSDLYKVLEGISYTLATHPDADLDRRTDDIIELLAAAQMPDGYLNTWHQVNKPDERWTNIRDRHELYCAGHLVEAAVAHHQATGKRNLLDIALKFCEHIWLEFGPSGKATACGHPEIELALMKLWRLTGEQRWFDLTQRFLDNRGNGYFADEHGTPRDEYDGTYWIDDMPVQEHKHIKGHAVRATYLMSSVADVAMETGEPALLEMLQAVWLNATEKRVYVTGGIGSSGSNEGFTEDFDLPNLTAYQETCASIAMALWGRRMAALFEDARYIDHVENALYNAMLSGVGLDGKSFFYENPLESKGDHLRQPWFTCACCPPNILRTIASIGEFIYSRSDDTLVVNLYVGGKLNTEIGGKPFEMEVVTDLPWAEGVELRIQSDAELKIRLRDPSWGHGIVTVNGEDQMLQRNQGYFELLRSWKAGDVIKVQHVMLVGQLLANPNVVEDRGCSALQRGPLVYCLEEIDNKVDFWVPYLPLSTHFDISEEDIGGGIVVIEAEGKLRKPIGWEDRLYAAATLFGEMKLRFIPYAYWANREPCPMQVWIPR